MGKAINEIKADTGQERFLSVDFFRGLTMFLLVANFVELFDIHSSNALAAFFGTQLDHADWAGLHFWDLIQPFFMFIVGVSMPFSFSKKWAKGKSWNSTFHSALRRSLVLLFLGWLLGSTLTQSSFTNVLAQLAVTYLIAFLVMRLKLKWQLLISFALIILTDIIYRSFSVPGFDQPFTADHNFGSWLDIFITGNLSDDRWVAFNAIPTTAHTIWGVIAGTILMNDWPAKKKFLTLLIAGIIGIVIGYILGLYIPIIKRVCTSSFIIVSGGWSLFALAISYLLIDILHFNKVAIFFAVVGMNPLFIYLFVHAGGKNVIKELEQPLIYRLFNWMGSDAVLIASVIAVSASLWYICYFLYKKKIFIRI